MKYALVNDRLTLATPGAPKTATCPNCEGQVMRRCRQGTYFWRHVQLPREGCRPSKPGPAESRDDKHTSWARQVGDIVVELHLGALDRQHLQLRSVSAEAAGDLSGLVVDLNEVQPLVEALLGAKAEADHRAYNLDDGGAGYGNDLLSKACVDNIIASMADTLIVVNPDATIRMVNPAAVDLLGYEAEEVIGKLVDLIFAEGEFSDGTGVDGFIQRGFIRKVETTYLARDGKKIPVSFSASIMRDKEGRIQGVVCVAKDISERKQAEAALRALNQSLEQRVAERTAALEELAAELTRSNQELERFAYVTSHDLQEPLRKVRVFGNRLQARCGEVLGDEGRNCLARMQDATQRMQNLINALLTYSQVTTQAQPFVPVDLNELVQEVMSDLEGRIEQVGGRVEVKELPTIDADPVRMRQLMQNLVSNGLKFHRPGETPVVQVYAAPVKGQAERPVGESRSDRWCQIIVQDNGIGFEEKYLDRIFQPFRRLHGRDEYEGTGIGLAICRKIVESHHGSITARSTPGCGAAFIVTLPLRQP